MQGLTSSISFSRSEYTTNNCGRAFAKLMNTADEIMASIASKVFSYKLLHKECYLSNFPQFAKEFAAEHNVMTTSIRACNLEKRKQEFFYSVMLDLQERITNKFREIQPEVLQLSIYWKQFWWNGFVEDAAFEPICELIDQLDKEFPGVVEEFIILDFTKVEFNDERPLDEFSLLKLSAVNYVEPRQGPLNKFAFSEDSFWVEVRKEMLFLSILQLFMKESYTQIIKTGNEILESIADRVFKQKLAQSMLYKIDFPRFSANFAVINKVSETSSLVFNFEVSENKKFSVIMKFIRLHIKAAFMKVQPEIIDLTENWKSSWWDRLIENAGIESLSCLFEQLDKDLHPHLEKVLFEFFFPDDDLVKDAESYVDLILNPEDITACTS